MIAATEPRRTHDTHSPVVLQDCPTAHNVWAEPPERSDSWGRAKPPRNTPVLGARIQPASQSANQPRRQTGRSYLGGQSNVHTRIRTSGVQQLPEARDAERRAKRVQEHQQHSPEACNVVRKIIRRKCWRECGGRGGSPRGGGTRGTAGRHADIHVVTAGRGWDTHSQPYYTNTNRLQPPSAHPGQNTPKSVLLPPPTSPPRLQHKYALATIYILQRPTTGMIWSEYAMNSRYRGLQKQGSYLNVSRH